MCWLGLHYQPVSLLAAAAGATRFDSFVTLCAQTRKRHAWHLGKARAGRGRAGRGGEKKDRAGKGGGGVEYCRALLHKS